MGYRESDLDGIGWESGLSNKVKKWQGCNQGAIGDKEWTLRNQKELNIYEINLGHKENNLDSIG